MPRFEVKKRFPFPRQALAAYHMRPGAFQRLVQPWDDVELVEVYDRLEDGARLTFRVSQGGIPLTWVAVHEDVDPEHHFVDVQERGPFASWRHRHSFLDDDGGSILVDAIDYKLPMGPLGEAFGGATTRSTLERMFSFRHSRTEQDISRHQAYADRAPMRVAITGASGLIGQALSAFLTTGGHSTTAVSRRGGDGRIAWDPSAGKLDKDALEGFDAIIHLAGDPIADGRWSDDKKRRVLESRTRSTSLLCERILELERPPKVVLSASAIGYYGDTGAREVREADGPGDLFLSEVCKAWEDATAPLQQHDSIRLAIMRIGLVATPAGGFLAELLKPFKVGAGGKLGSGNQYMSWIHIDDLIYAMHFLLHEEVRGPVNLVGPAPMTNAALTEVVGKVMSRPTFATAPAFALKMALGAEKAHELLLAGQRVLPAALLDAGFHFSYPDLEGALRHLLGR